MLADGEKAEEGWTVLGGGAQGAAGGRGDRGAGRAALPLSWTSLPPEPLLGTYTYQGPGLLKTTHVKSMAAEFEGLQVPDPHDIVPSRLNLAATLGGTLVFVRSPMWGNGDTGV